MSTIIISGTPGTGKSTLAKVLVSKIKFKFLNIEPVLKKISEGYDKKKYCKIINLKKFNQEIIKLIKKEKKDFIIASHLIHHLPKEYVDLCLITQCSDLKALKKRLQKRKYSCKKIEENLQCEIFEICLSEARENGHKVLVVETSKKINFGKLIKEIKKKIKK